MNMVHLGVHDLGCFYGAREVLQGVSFNVVQGDFVGIIGPNGSGKSTLLKTISRVIIPRYGRVLLQERDLLKMSNREVASKMAVVSQEDRAEFAFQVWEVVQMGRFPHLSRFQRESKADRKKVIQALEMTNILHLGERLITELSAGEQQRVLLARALAQEPEILLLDEPTSHLDVGHQIEILDLITDLRRSTGLTVVMVLHDLNLAAQYCDYLIMLKNGEIFTIGTPEKVITLDSIREVYGSQVLISQHPYNNRPQVVLLPGSITGERGKFLVKKPAVHVVGGGGASKALIESLVVKGYPVTLGVVNVNDSDWERAQRLGVLTIESPPFSFIDDSLYQLNLQAMQKAQLVILADIPFGPGNLPNLKAVAQRAKDGQTIMVINGEIAGRDFTGGEAEQLFKQLLKQGVKVLNNWEQAVKHLDKIDEEGPGWIEAN